MILDGNEAESWREYQEGLKRKAWWSTFVNRATLTLIYMVLVGMIYTASGIVAHLEWEGEEHSRSGRWENIRPEKFVKKDLPHLLGPLKPLLAPMTNQYILAKDGARLTVETALDTALQSYVLDLLHRSQTLRASVVIMRPKTGQILVMADYEKQGMENGENLSLNAAFPAASLFKIVSAAAAIEARGFTPGSALAFRGMRHTLYNSQLKPGESRYSRKTSLKRAFSRSINPVFGKIGIYHLGRELMSKYAERFLFNQKIPFDVPVAPSTTQVPEDAFGLAEIASGFNKRTRLSPLHATMITAAVANHGNIIGPWVVRRIKDDSGNVLYRARVSRLGKAIEADTARDLRVLMEDTVTNGTGRKAFLPLRRKKSLKDIELGAKTGTINDHQDRYKYDWVTAYALPKGGDREICITVLAVHGKKLGIRAVDLARYIIKHYFTS